MTQLRRGSIAICSLGSIGLITSEGPFWIEYSDGRSGMAWGGIHLTDKIAKVGDLWSSRNPKVIGHIDDFEEYKG